MFPLVELLLSPFPISHQLLAFLRSPALFDSYCAMRLYLGVVPREFSQVFSIHNKHLLV